LCAKIDRIRVIESKGEKMNTNYAEIAQKLSGAVGLTKPLVAVKLFDDPHAVPEGLPRPQSAMYYCAAVGHAMQGETILMLSEDHGCQRGAYMLGVKEAPASITNGVPYAKSHMVASARAGQRLIDQAPKLPVGHTVAILLTPLAQTPVDPDVVLAAANPHQALQLLNATNFDTGLEIPLHFQILTSFCAYSTVLPFKSARPEATIPQEQARKRAGFTNEEMIVGLPAEVLTRAAEVIEGICCVVPQPEV
jgi:uncharacterized protein (DUF169 family)